jgi:hypothetical protein
MDLQQELGMSNDNWREPQVVEKLRTALANYVSGGEAKLDGADIKKFLEQSVAATGKPHEYFVEDGKLSAALQVRHSRNVESGNFEEAKDLAATFGLELSASKKAATAAATERAVFTNMAKRGHELLAIEAARKGQLPDGFGQRPDVQEKFVSWVKENYEPYKSWKDIEVGEAVADMWYRHTLPRWPMNPTNLAYLDIWNLGEALGIPENIISGPVVKDVVERNIEAYTRRGIVKSDNWIVSEAKARLGLNGG